MKTTTGLAMALSLAFYAGSALADSGKKQPGFDVNGDGMMTQKEAVDVKTWTFNRIDRDQDGTLTKRELRGLVKLDVLADNKDAVLEFMASRDYNSDGTITKAEYTEVTELFLTGDTDGDGMLSGVEVKNVTNSMGASALQ